MRIDPTAAVAPERIEYGLELMQRLGDDFDGELTAEELQNALRLNWLELQVEQLWQMQDAFVFEWNRWIMAYGPEEQREFLKRLGFAAPDWGFMIFAMVIAVIIFMLASYLLLNRRGRLPERQASTSGCFSKNCSLSRNPVKARLTILSARPGTTLPIQPVFEKIGGLYTMLSYGRESDPDGLQQLKRQVKAFKLSV